MKKQDIPILRMQATGLSSSPFQSPADVVEHLGAVQSQDFAAAKWAVSLRMQKATDKIVEQAFNKGAFLRTHVMRPTWHFIMPQDIQWMLQLTAPRIKRVLAPYDVKLDLTKETLTQSQKVIAKALEGRNFLTRTELADKLEEKHILVRGQRLNHLVVHAELDALICSGPRRGKQFTYGLLEEVAPNAKKLSREETLEKLALKYFRGHAPAQLKDFAWWSGLTVKDAEQALALAKKGLTAETVDGQTYWYSQNTNPTAPMKPTAYLLSIYDEYTIGYKDRNALGGERVFEKLIQMGNALTAVMVFDGKIVGTWKRQIKRGLIEIRFNPFVKLGVEERKHFQQAADRYGTFNELPIVITYQ